MTADRLPFSAVDHETVVSLLGDPTAYPDSTRDVQVIETHISQVFLTDHFVYKLKKPVQFDFLDFSTLDKREAACREELRLNRRMAYDVYLDVMPIVVEESGRLRLGGFGSVVDWVVRMKRLPAERMLDRLILANKLSKAEIEGVASFLADYYSRAEPLVVEGGAYRAAIAAHVADNRRVLLEASEIDTDCVRRLHTALLRHLAYQAEVFRARAHEGRVIDGHGDLRPEHVCLVEPPAVFDCVEFSADLRRVDILDDLCFLAMECDYAEAGDVGSRVLDAYRRRSHDDFRPDLILFYKLYRATVRAKVAALRAVQLEGRARQESYLVRDRYLELAEDYLRADGVRPLVILVTGLMGTGKSTLARAMGEALGIDVLRTDVVRNALVPVGDRPESFGEGRYRADARDRVYDELLRLARKHLSSGVSVILDGTFIQAAKREAVFRLAGDLKTDMLAVRCVCPRETALIRIQARLQSRESDPSEARPELYVRQVAEQEREGRHAGLEVDTTMAGDAQLARVLASLPMVFSVR